MASNNTRARREPTGGKSKMVAALLAFFLGALGVHQFYLGHGGRGTGRSDAGRPDKRGGRFT